MSGAADDRARERQCHWCAQAYRDGERYAAEAERLSALVALAVAAMEAASGTLAALGAHGAANGLGIIIERVIGAPESPSDTFSHGGGI